MASHKVGHANFTRLGPQADIAQRNQSTRLPVRNAPAVASSQRTVPIITSSSRLTKKPQYTGRDDERGYASNRSVQKGAVSLPAPYEETRRGAPPPSKSGNYPSPQLPESQQMKASHRVVRLEPTRTPSLVSGSSASTADSPKSNSIRRRPGIGVHYTRTSPSDSMYSQEEQTGVENAASTGYKDPYPDAVLGIGMPPPSSQFYQASDGTFIQMDGYVDPSTLGAGVLTQPTPIYALSTTPSTGYSPGPFSVASTPTSMSSHSPGLALSGTARSGSRPLEASPPRNRRPSVTRNVSDEKTSKAEPDRLNSLRESTSSAASTVRASDSFRRPSRKAKAPLMPAPPPTPPQTRLPGVSTVSRLRAPSDARTADKQSSAQTYPEFAHLNNVPPRKGSFPAAAPVRPSRDGTPEMNFHQISPVIQSNMTSLPMTLHKRQSSSESKRTNASTLSLDTAPRLVPTRSISRNTSPSPSQSSALSPFNSQPPTRGITPDVPSDSERSVRSKTTPQTMSKPFTKFGFFSKKSKSEHGPAVLTKERPTRKGPAAGTGHEGYGKFAVRGRSGSTTSGTGSTSVGRSPSADSTPGSLKPSSRKSSLESQASSDIDEFLAERLSPITIRGTAAHNLQSGGSSQSSAGEITVRGLGLSSTTASSSTTSLNGILKQPVLLPSPMSDSVRSKGSEKRPSTSHGDKNKESSKGSRFGVSTLSSKRTSFMSTKPDKINSAASSTSNLIATGRKGSEPVGLSRTVTASSEEKDWPRPPKKAETVPKVAASSLKAPRKWNFFQRAKSPAQSTKQPQAVPVTVSRQQPTRSVAHYAMVEPRNAIDLEELERIMSEAEKDSDGPQTVRRGKSTERKADKGKRPMHGNSILLPEPPAFVPELAGPSRPASPKVSLQIRKEANDQVQAADVAPQPLLSSEQNASVYAGSHFAPPGVSQPPVFPEAVETPTTTHPSTLGGPTVALPRPSRLPQVGRIPKVISTRDRQTEGERQLSDASFSRPFAPSHPSPAGRVSIGNVLNILSAAGPQLRTQTGLGFASFGSSDYPLSPPLDGGEDQHLSPDSVEPEPHAEFLVFPPRKNSEQSTCSSSSGMLHLIPVVPGSGQRSGEDEVWGEYDDFLDALSPRTPKTPKSAISAGSSAGGPFHYTTTLAHPDTKHAGLGPNSNVSGPVMQGHQVHVKETPGALAPSVGAIAQQMRIPSTTDSMLLSNVPPLHTPTSPVSISDFVNGYGERNLSVIDPTSGRLSLPSSGRFSGTSVRHSLPATSRPTSNSNAATAPLPRLPGSGSSPKTPNKRRESHIIEMAEKEHMGLENMANLRFGALMTSKWLSFGRVLFSPVHHELKNPAEDRVLILDGLGKDWSYYVALTYPQASIYNLGSAPAEAAGSPSSGGIFQSLPNHRHINHPSLSSPFPFPKGFFAAVVFRFPVATQEAAYRAALFECKRVLRPGGYLELSVLDIDMLNMGNRARRAVRQLKMEMQALDPGISLKPLSDSMQKLLGRRGFENLNRCIVGVPATGRIPEGRDESSDDSSATARQGSASKTPRIPVLDHDMPSFSDLLHGQSRECDEGITKMVARVGQWWYSRCYESIVLPNGDPAKSMWADDALVRECEKRGTSLRLMICFAQKPECNVRRTISV